MNPKVPMSEDEKQYWIEVWERISKQSLQANTVSGILGREANGN